MLSSAPIFMGLALGVSLQLVGCVHVPATPPEITEWTRVANADGCVSFRPSRGRPYDISIKLKPEFENKLVAQIGQQPIETPSCWYELPDGRILLRAGHFCGFPKEAHFQETAAGWELAEFKEVYIQCEQRAK